MFEKKLFGTLSGSVIPPHAIVPYFSEQKKKGFSLNSWRALLGKLILILDLDLSGALTRRDFPVIPHPFMSISESTIVLCSGSMPKSQAWFKLDMEANRYGSRSLFRRNIIIFLFYITRSMNSNGLVLFFFYFK